MPSTVSSVPPFAAGAVRRGAPWLLLLTLAAGWMVGRAGRGFMGVESVLCIALGALILAPLAARWATGEFDMFEPVVLIAGVYFLYFVVGPLVRFSMDDMVFVGRDFRRTYARGLLAVLLVVASIWAGYATPVGPRPPAAGAAPERPWDPRTARRLAWGLVLLALFCMVAWTFVAGRSLGTFFLPGVLGSTGSGEGVDVAYLFLAIEWFIPAGLVLMATGGFRGRLSFGLYLLLISIVYVSIGFRYRLVVLWLAVGMLAYLRMGKRPRLATLIPTGLAAFLFVGWLAWARFYFRSAGAVGGLSFDLGDMLQGALSDTRIFETFSVVLEVVPSFVDYVGIDPFAYVLILPVPRFLWPDKPNPEWLYEVGASIGTEEAAMLGAAVPHFGEWYMAFGWPGMAVGAFVFGVAVKWLWRWFRVDPADPWRQVIFAIHNAFLFQMIIRGYLAQIVQEWCFIILPAIAIMWASRRAARGPAAEAHA